MEQDSPVDQRTEETNSSTNTGQDPSIFPIIRWKEFVTILAGLVTIVSGMSSAVTFVLERRRTLDSGQATLDDYVR